MAMHIHLYTDAILKCEHTIIIDLCSCPFPFSKLSPMHAANYYFFLCFMFAILNICVFFVERTLSWVSKFEEALNLLRRTQISFAMHNINNISLVK